MPVSSGDPALERVTFHATVETARQQISTLLEKAKVELGEEKTAIVEVQMPKLLSMAAGRIPEARKIVCGSEL